jgi:hypothetical protein
MRPLLILAVRSRAGLLRSELESSNASRNTAHTANVEDEMSGECDKPDCPVCQELYGPQEVDFAATRAAKAARRERMEKAVNKLATTYLMCYEAGTGKEHLDAENAYEAARAAVLAAFDEANQ